MRLRDKIAQLKPEQRAALSMEELRLITWRMEWEAKAHAYQLPPDDQSWTIFLMLMGRGTGKTRTGAQETAWNALSQPGTRWLVAAPTAGDLKSICYEGESGLLAVIPDKMITNYNSSLHELTVQGGSLIKGIPASEPDRFRGPNFHGGWLDELAAWQYLKEAMDNIMFSMRLGQRPRIIVTTTPRPRPEIREMVKRDGNDVIVRRASTYANLMNLAPTFRDQILKYEGTPTGRQEIHAELLDPSEQGIVKRSQIRMWPAAKQLPWFDYIILSLDTALTEETRDKNSGNPDYTAGGVWGLFQFERRPNAMMIDAWQERLGFPDLIRRIKDEMKAEYGQLETPILRPLIGPATVALETKKIDLLLIEDKGSGRSARQQLASQDIYAMAYNPGRAKKLERLHAISHLFAGGAKPGPGVIWVPEGRRAIQGKPGEFQHTGEFASWAGEAIEQWCTFSGEGSIPHDDHIDQMTQALRVLGDRNMLDTIRRDPNAASAAQAQPVINPYAS